MNSLIEKEKKFLLLLLHTSDKQKKVLIQNTEKLQLSAIVQTVYNILICVRPLTEKNKKQVIK
jgi:hypothetical protein